MRKFCKFLSVFLGAVMAATLGGCTVTQEMVDRVETLAASGAGIANVAGTGDYGDEISAVNSFDEEKYVGIFYCLWMGNHGTGTQDGKKNISDVYYGPDALNKYPDTVLNVDTLYRYWGEPLYGYYRSDDEWVIRKHLQLLTLAGVDYLALDTTNAVTYDRVLEVLLSCIAEYRGAGIAVPQVLFLTNTSSTATALHLYETFYTDPAYAACWFRGRGGKPWISCFTDQKTSADRKLLESYFYVKDPQWPTESYKPNGLPWIDWNYPQHAFYESQIKGNLYAVSVAQHAGIAASAGGIQFSDSAYARLLIDNNLDTKNDQGLTPDQVYNKNFGRGYDFDTGKNAYEDMDRVRENVNFRQQWDTVLADPDAKMVVVLGWNEWIAGNWQENTIPNHYDDLNATMCDLTNLEFSRDVEMMAEGENSYFDNCYLQLCRYIRAFKGQGTGSAFLDSRRTVTSDRIVPEEWEDAASYLSFGNSAKARTGKDAFKQSVSNTTGRNDILSVKAASDAQKVYFLIETQADITQKEAEDTRWMNLYIGVDGAEAGAGFNGLQYVVNRTSSGGTASLHRIAGRTYEEVLEAGCTYVLSGRQMLVALPKAALGIEGSEFSLSFKVADNNRADFDLTDLYTNGDVAPLGRLNYRYTAK